VKKSKEEIAEVKEKVLDFVGDKLDFFRTGRATYDVWSFNVHVRFCSKQLPEKEQYWFNINSNTLRADFEVWICGGQDSFYVMPTEVIRDMYEDPDSIVDSTYPDFRVVTVFVEDHEVLYAKPGVRMKIEKFYCKGFLDMMEIIEQKDRERRQQKTETTIN